MLEGVADQVHHRLVQALLVSLHHRRRGLLHPHLPLAERRGLRRQVADELRQVEGVRRDEVGLLGPGQSQQILDDPGHAIQLGRDQVHRRLPLLRVLAQQLQLTPDHRDRGPQLVSGVVHEAPLGGEGFLQAVQHPVECDRQRRHLVVALDVDPL